MKRTGIMPLLLGILFLAGCGSTQQGDGSAAVENAQTAAVVVTCDSALSAGGDLKIELPDDGVLAELEELSFAEGATALDVLKEGLREAELPFEANGGYVTGIGNLYAGDCGEESGWMYRVNGEAPSVGADQYVLADGDVMEWYYICSYDEIK